MFVTLTWCVPAHTNAHTTASGKKNPSALPALMPAIFTFGATPTMPIPLEAAAIVPAVWVPWPLSSSHAPGELSATPPMHEALSAKSTFGARSGWVQSSPVSMSPTTTNELPAVIAWASGVWIWTMSHWSPDSESPSVAGVVGTASEPEPPCAPSFSFVANAPVAETPITFESLRSRFAAKVVLEDEASATPICR